MLYDRQILVSAFCIVYRTIVASAPLLRFAIERSDGDLKAYYEKHLQEEVGHEDMLLDDLKRLGMEVIPLSFVAAQLAGSAYYFIEHEHPAMLLGYMHALERNSPPVELVDDLSRFHGVELKALRHHAQHDPGHRADLEEMIAALPEELRGKVLWCSDRTAELVGRALL